MQDIILRAAEAIKKSKNLISLTGAGISVESGIPDFRSAGGLWEKYDPSIYASIETFNNRPEKAWDMIFEMVEVTASADPNPGHTALADLEAMGYLKAIITQNIDNLHQEGGSKEVIEYHGNASRLECQKCKSSYVAEDFDISTCEIPRCRKCSRILKPDVVFFGEMIPREALLQSDNLARFADAVIVVGTSAQVYPAASIPYEAKERGATIIEFNIEKTGLTRQITDIFIEGPAGTTLPQVVEALKH